MVGMSLAQKSIAVVITLGLNVLLFLYIGFLALLFTVPSVAFLGQVVFRL